MPCPLARRLILRAPHFNYPALDEREVEVLREEGLGARALPPLAATAHGHRRRGPNATDPSSEGEESPEEIRHLTIVPIAGLNLASVRALAYAASMQQPVLALHISPNAEEAGRFRDYWSVWGDHLPLEVVISPYRAIVAPLIHHIEAIHRHHPDLTLTVILPELVVRHWWHRPLHSRLAPRLRGEPPA